MRIAVVGPGRAGTALAIAAHRAGHDIVAVLGRTQEHAQAGAGRFGAVAQRVGDPVPPVDLLLIAVGDDSIGHVAESLAPTVGDVSGAVHLSGATSVEVLAPIAAAGVTTGAFHPLQTLPNPEAGAARLGGAWFAVTADSPLRESLHELAASIGGLPFDLDDAHKPAYHAAAAASANFPLAALTVARDLFDAAGVPFAAARPLVEAIIANAFDQGPAESLTGPIARGDVATVATQLAAVAEETPEWQATFRCFLTATALVAGTTDQFEELL
ncbi:MAG: hypothetical protein BMS9Abin07_0995 [Acidimicrobiia bacterium]|nr:MAG: hypothetical protein BMS9Abin07_0995 [Acidimicrobiia bacterium]